MQQSSRMASDVTLLSIPKLTKYFSTSYQSAEVETYKNVGSAFFQSQSHYNIMVQQLMHNMMIASV